MTVATVTSRRAVVPQLYSPLVMHVLGPSGSTSEIGKHVLQLPLTVDGVPIDQAHPSVSAAAAAAARR
jgi:hypothetical protein